MALKGRNTVGVSATGSGKTLGTFCLFLCLLYYTGSSKLD